MGLCRLISGKSPLDPGYCCPDRAQARWESHRVRKRYSVCILGALWTLNLTTSATTDLRALYVLSQHIVDTRSHDIGDTMSHDFVDTGGVVVAGENDEFYDIPDPSNHHQLRPDAAERVVRDRVLPRPHVKPGQRWWYTHIRTRRAHNLLTGLLRDRQLFSWLELAEDGYTI